MTLRPPGAVPFAHRPASQSSAPSSSPDQDLVETLLYRLKGHLPAALQSELDSISQEKNPVSQLGNLLHFTRRLEAADQVPAAQEILSFLSTAAPEAWREAATQRLSLLHGEGSLGAQTERWLGHFAKEVTDPASLAAMGVGIGIARLTRAGILAGSLRSAPSLWTRGSLALSAAAFGSFGAEVGAFTIAGKAVGGWLGRPQDWGWGSLGQESLAAALLLGPLKIFGHGARVLMPEWKALGSQLGMFSGVMLGQEMQVRFGLTPRTDAPTAFAHGLVSLLHLNVGGALAIRALGPRFHGTLAELDMQVRQGGGGTGSVGAPFMAPSSAVATTLRLGHNAGAINGAPTFFSMRGGGEGAPDLSFLRLRYGQRLRSDLADKLRFEKSPILDVIVDNFIQTDFSIDPQRMLLRYYELLSKAKLPLDPRGEITCSRLLERATATFQHLQRLQPFHRVTGNLYDHLLQFALEQTLQGGAPKDFSKLLEVAAQERTVRGLEKFLVEFQDPKIYQLETITLREMQRKHPDRFGRLLGLYLPRPVMEMVFDYLETKSGLTMGAEQALQGLESFVFRYGTDSRPFDTLVRAMRRAEESKVPLLWMDRIFKVLATDNMIPKLREIADWTEVDVETVRGLLAEAAESGDFSEMANKIYGSVYTGYVQDMELAKKIAVLYGQFVGDQDRIFQNRHLRESRQLADHLLSRRERILKKTRGASPAGAYHPEDILEMLMLHPTELAIRAHQAIRSGEVEFLLLQPKDFLELWNSVEANSPAPPAFFLPPENSPGGRPSLVVRNYNNGMERVLKGVGARELAASVVHEFEHAQHHRELDWQEPSQLLIAEMRALAETVLFRSQHGKGGDWELAQDLSPQGIGMYLRSQVDVEYLTGRTNFSSSVMRMSGGKPALTTAALSPEVLEVRGILADHNLYQRQLLRFALQKLVGLKNQPLASADVEVISAWLAEVQRVYEMQNQSLIEHRARLFDLQTLRGLPPESWAALQRQEEAHSTLNLRLARQLSLVLDTSKSNDLPTQAQMERRLRWISTIPEFSSELTGKEGAPLLHLEPNELTSPVGRYSVALELLRTLLPGFSEGDSRAFHRAMSGFSRAAKVKITNRDIAFDVDSTLGDTLVRTAAGDALRGSPEKYEALRLDDFIHQFSRLRIPYRHMQATLLGLWATGNRLRLFTAAENLPDNLEAFLNDFPLLKVAFNLVPAEDPLRLVSSADLDASPFFMDGLKRRRFYQRHFESPEGEELLEKIRQESGFRSLDFMKTTKMPFPDFPFQVLVDDLGHYYAGELETLGFGKRWIMAPGSGEALYEKLMEYFSQPLPETAPHMRRWLGEK